MATHSCTLAWRIPWTEEPGGLQSMGLQNRTRLCDFHFHKGPIFKYSPILRQWGSRTSTYKFWGRETIQPRTKNYLTNQRKIKSREVEEIQ